jgi:hypothetical protein
MIQAEIPRGFNTYYNNSVLTHVLMPSGIAVSLGFKFFNTGTVIREALIGRPGKTDELIHPGPRSLDGRYTELRLICSDHEIIIRSAAVGDNQYLLVTPVKNGPRPPALLISMAILWNKVGCVTLAGDTIRAVSPDRTVEVFADGKRTRQLNTGITGPCIAVELGGPSAVSTGEPVSAVEMETIMRRQKKLILDEAAEYGELSEAYNAMRTCLAWDTIYEPEQERLCSPVSRLWNINWGGFVLFDWDTYFSSMMLAAIGDKNLAYANTIAITEQKTESGFVPNYGAADDNKSRDRSQPPVGSLAVREIYRKYRDKEFVACLFDDLLIWNRWFAGNRRLENGQLCWGSAPYRDRDPADGFFDRKYINTGVGAALESGLDNSPMYDDMPFDTNTHLMGLADVGLTGLYILDCENLAELADVIGRPEAAELRDRSRLSKAGLEDLWDEEFGLYLNRNTVTGESSRRISPTNFYALFSDHVSGERAERMIREHFFNPREFYGEYMLPSISRSDPAYIDQNYWRGRIWAPLNYLVYIALRRHKLEEACSVLAEKSKNLLMLEWTLHGHIHENYHGDTGMGCGGGKSDKFYHWGALLSLIALTEAGYAEGPEKPLAG